MTSQFELNMPQQCACVIGNICQHGTMEHVAQYVVSLFRWLVAVKHSY
jgi:hypothetical protein